MEPRRQFRLPAEDQPALDRLGLRWETLVDQKRQWVVISDFTLPSGFIQATAHLAIEINGAYPVGPLDMAYFSPALCMPSGRVIPQTQVTEQIDGRPFQRWSRHRTSENQWRPGEDSLDTHIDYIVAFLTHETERGC